MLLELLQVDRRVLGGHVARRGHRGLHDEEVRARLFGDLGEALGALRDRRDDDRSPALLDLGDALVDQLFLDRLAVDPLNDLRRLLEAGGGDAIEHGIRIFIAGEDPLEVDDREPPSRPISMAREGLTTPSMAAAMMGMSNRRPQSSHEMSTSLGLMVSAPGTRAISSKPYAALALRPRPTHMPMRRILLGPALRQGPVCRELPRCRYCI